MTLAVHYFAEKFPILFSANIYVPVIIIRKTHGMKFNSQQCCHLAAYSKTKYKCKQETFLYTKTLTMA